jgi:phosphoribosylanthranilate isomerase
MIAVKMCGITNLEDALICINSGAAALGFVFAASQRRVDPAAVTAITRRLPESVIRIGVFVNEDPALVREILKDCRLDLAQLHGEETPEQAASLKGRAIKAFKAGKDRPGSEWGRAGLRAALIDTYCPVAAGGSGRTFDWDLFNHYRNLGVPLILAGGLHSGNLAEAVKHTKADAIDVSSGVELRPGIKDPSRVREFMAVAHGLDPSEPSLFARAITK